MSYTRFRTGLKKEKPELSIMCAGGQSLGRCYSASYYRIVSTKMMSQPDILKLRDAGFLGYGQEFYIHSQCDGKELPVGEDTNYFHIITDDGIDLGINPDYKPFITPFYVYECESRVDSSD